MTPPDTIPAAIVLPAAAALWTVVLWPLVPKRLRERLTPHHWVGGWSRVCIAHDRCRGRVRYYNERGVRLCTASIWPEPLPSMIPGEPMRTARAPMPCDLHQGHRPKMHYNIAADRTWS